MQILRLVRCFSFVLLMLALTASCFAGVSVSVSLAPPVLPVYEQPPCPGDGYIWTPGYWAYDYDDGDYYWVPGTWVEAPEV
ncbi:MAG TPA: YXWGXW repeat-containing protein, partial [Terriglobales bacterium]|nr:YXWGXW repeat-containing protein [Terriglobales bacterium]